MILNYIKIALRNLWRHRFFTIINILGLTLAVTVSLVIYLFVSKELNHDRGLAKKDNIYRLLRKASLNTEDYLVGITSGPFAAALTNDFPQEVEQTLRVYPDRALVRYEEQAFLEENFMLADSNFFDVFNYSFVAGNPIKALKLPNSIVLTEQSALKYFGEDDPMGKSLRVDDRFDFVVTGVVRPGPGRSHLTFDFLANIAPLRNFNWFSDWWSNALVTYVVLKDAADPLTLEEQFPAFMDKYFGDDFIRSKNRIDLLLQPLEDIYFYYDVRYDPVAHGNEATVLILAMIGCFIIIIACINFTNLATAKSMTRAREVGIRKTLGSSRERLILQFLAESYLITLFAVVLGFMTVELSLSAINKLFEIDLYLSWLDQELWLLAGGVVLILGFLTGAYPAFLMSAFSPTTALKGTSVSGRRKVSVRRIMVIIQFAIAIFLITSTFVIGDQLEYLNKRNLGFDKENVVLLALNNAEIREHLLTFKNELEQNSAILHTSGATGEPGGFHDTMAHEIEGLEENLRFRTVFADFDYVKSLGIEVVAGRDFSRDYGTDAENAVLLNETAVREIGWTPDEAIGKKIRNVFTDSIARTITGVVRDYHFASLKTEVEPLIISAMEPGNGALMVIRFTGNSTRETMAFIEQKWKAFSSYPMASRFLDSSLDRLYDNERLQARLFGAFSSVAVLVACLGIFGLASFVIVERSREMGIRKVLGATVVQITMLLTGGFIAPVLIANLLAIPLSWYFSHSWLSSFAYRTGISWAAFAFAACIAAMLAFLSVIFQSLKTTRTNPVDVLKEE